MDSGVIVYESADGQLRINVKLEDETAWLTQQQLAELFHTSRTNVVEHIKHIYDEEELEIMTTCRKFRHVQTEGTREVSRELSFYNLDMIISLGYRILCPGLKLTCKSIFTNGSHWWTDRPVR